MLIFAKLFVFSQEVHQVARHNQIMREALDVFERMPEAPLPQVDNDIIDVFDVFVNELVINCVGFCITDCVFTGGGGESWA